MILSCFVLGLSVRKVSEALLPILGRPISPSTVSTVAKQLDAVVAAFHARPLKDRHPVLMLDGVVLARCTGAGAIKRPVLVALGLRPDGKKEVIDFRLAQSESAAEWERFLGDLIRRGLVGDGLQMICLDGGSGLIAAQPTAYPGIPVQRCWAHKIRNVLDKVRAGDHDAVKADLHAIMNAKTVPQARSAARRFADRWQADYPKAVRCLRMDLDEVLTCRRYRSSPNARWSEPPMQSNAASARCDDAPGPWASSQTEPQWTASSSPSSTMKTETRASAPLSC
jgi:putative transposase